MVFDVEHVHPPRARSPARVDCEMPPDQIVTASGADRDDDLHRTIGPGGSYDLGGRQLADALSKRMGQAFVVENKPGAGTVVGTQAASQSEADGYTLVVGGLSNMAFNSALYSKLAYDPRKDFAPVALIYKFGYVMVGRKDLPHGKLADIVAVKGNALNDISATEKPIFVMKRGSIFIEKK